MRIALSGDVERPTIISMADLLALPPLEQTVSYATGHGNQTRTYRGASLWTIIDRAGIKTASAASAEDAYADHSVTARPDAEKRPHPARPGGKKGALQTKYLQVTAADSYRVVFSLGELKPDLGGRASLLAYTEVRDGISSPTTKLTAPGDAKGGRYVSMPTGIELRASGSTKTATGGGFAQTITVSGAVQRPGSFNVAALKNMPAVARQVGRNHYQGVDLWYLLNTVAGIQAPAGAKDSSLTRYVVATASDGYQALFSLGELDPAFGGVPALVAYEIDGQPLDRSGYARLLAPADARPGRSVANLVDLEVFVAPSPH